MSTNVLFGLPLLLLFASGCSDDDLASSTSSASSGATGTTSTSDASSTGTGGAGGAGGGATSSSSGTGGAGGQGETLNDILEALRQDRDGTLQAKSDAAGWPLPVDGGYLFVNTDPTLPNFAGDYDAWAGTPMTQDQGFSWLVLPVVDGNHYKFTNGYTYSADPWARAYTYDSYGEISLVRPSDAHLDRYFAVGDANNEARTLRIWVPSEPVERVLYVHDGQNLFDPDAFWGGWHLQDSALPGMLLVGIDNTFARMDEYTHVQDDIGQLVGGAGDAYADFVENTVRPLVKARYGEPGKVGTMGSSLGGLISLHIADRNPGAWDFAASLSGTLGWGSIGLNNETLIERFAAHGHQNVALYVDSGGFGTCFDSDNDGIEDDDPNAGDNYCENQQFLGVLQAAGYVDGVDLTGYWEPNAEHNEAEWAARVWRPLSAFDAL